MTTPNPNDPADLDEQTQWFACEFVKMVKRQARFWNEQLGVVKKITYDALDEVVDKLSAHPTPESPQPAPEAKTGKVRTWCRGVCYWQKVGNAPIEVYDHSLGAWVSSSFAQNITSLLRTNPGIVETTPPDPTPAAETITMRCLCGCHKKVTFKTYTNGPIEESWLLAEMLPECRERYLSAKKPAVETAKPEPSDEAKKLAEEIKQAFDVGTDDPDALDVDIITPHLTPILAERDAAIKRAEEAEEEAEAKVSLIDRLDTAEKSLAAMTAERDRLRAELAKAQALNRKSYAWCSDGRLHVFDPQRPPQCPENCGYAKRPFAADMELLTLNAELARMKPVVEGMAAYRQDRISASELLKIADAYQSSNGKVQP